MTDVPFLENLLAKTSLGDQKAFVELYCRTVQ